MYKRKVSEKLEINKLQTPNTKKLSIQSFKQTCQRFPHYQYV